MTGRRLLQSLDLKAEEGRDRMKMGVGDERKCVEAEGVQQREDGIYDKTYQGEGSDRSEVK